MNIAPADFGDLAKLRQAFPRRLWKGLVVQLARSPAIVVKDGEEVLALAGLYPMGGHGELWLEFAPCLRAEPERARQVLRAMKRFQASLPEGVRIETMVKCGHEPGVRLARFFGFVADGELYDGMLKRFTLDPPAQALPSPASPTLRGD